MKTRLIVALTVSAIVMMSVLTGGCLRWKWTTFEWGNETSEKVWVGNVNGFSEAVAPGWLLPNEKPVDRTLKYGDPVRVEKNIVIRWKIGSEEHEQVLPREQSGLAEELNGITVRFTYQANGKWKIEQLR